MRSGEFASLDLQVEPETSGIMHALKSAVGTKVHPTGYVEAIDGLGLAIGERTRWQQTVTLDIDPLQALRMMEYFAKGSMPSRDTNCAGFLLYVLGATNETYVDPSSAMNLLSKGGEVASLEQMQPYAFALSEQHTPHHFAFGIDTSTVLSVDGAGGRLRVSGPEEFTLHRGVVQTLALK